LANKFIEVNYTQTPVQIGDPEPFVSTITNITRANPAVVTSPSHGFQTGDVGFITGVSGMTQVNATVYSINVVDANTFQLFSIISPFGSIDSTGFGAYTSGGNFTLSINPILTQVVIVYDDTNQFAQIVDSVAVGRQKLIEFFSRATIFPR
jgi:hypothetical protein